MSRATRTWRHRAGQSYSGVQRDDRVAGGRRPPTTEQPAADRHPWVAELLAFTGGQASDLLLSGGAEGLNHAPLVRTEVGPGARRVRIWITASACSSQGSAPGSADTGGNRPASVASASSRCSGHGRGGLAAGVALGDQLGQAAPGAAGNAWRVRPGQRGSTAYSENSTLSTPKSRARRTPARSGRAGASSSSDDSMAYSASTCWS